MLLTLPLRAQTRVNFCDLIRNPEAYDGKTITVRATYRYGFEWSELYCLECLDKGKAWLELPSTLDDASTKQLKLTPKGAGIVNLTVTATFESGGHFGHMGYRYKFVASQIADVAVLSKGMKSIAEEKGVEQRWACGGTDPK